MADENVVANYGFETDEVTVSNFNFGLNAGKTFLKKFEWIPNAGKDGAEQQAVEIQFEIDGSKKSHRMFPVTQAFGKNQEKITDPNAPEFKEAVKDFNASIYHIAHVFVDEATYKATIARPFTSFKDFITVVASMLPKNFAEIPLDCFMQYQWQPSAGKNRTYLELPRKMKTGRWLVKAQEGTWIKNIAESITVETKEALWYTNEKGEKHPFVKNGWFMLSSFANQLNPSSSQNGSNSGSSISSGSNLASTSDANNAAGVAQNTGGKPGTW